ncbi:hypothetical protein FJY71_03225, partial [candidate division WOR-3 bacterium]|nr:hypothetical protein [candidate division WOR-3 bacterium]
MAEAGGTFFVRARQAQPAWQPFLLATGAPASAVELVLAAPEFLNLTDQPAVSFCAAAPVAGSTGAASRILVAVDEAGRVFLVACPDETEKEPYANLAADVLAAGGRLWRMGYDAFDGLFRQAGGARLDEVVLLRARPTWDFDAFRPAVERSLEQGRFPTLVLTARPSGQVRDTLEYLAGMNVEARAAGVLFEERAGIQVALPLPASGFKAAGVSPPARPVASPSTGHAEMIGAPAPEPRAEAPRRPEPPN